MTSIWMSKEFDDHEQVCQFSDPKTGLRAIVAIHSSVRGPAAGGTRFFDYANDDLALDDALRLSRAMSYKSALAGLPVGGGKAVILGDPRRIKNTPLLQAYGRFINRIGASFATGEDVGMTLSDLETIREVCPYAGGTSAGAGDPSIHTAVGVMHGLRAVLTKALGREDFKGVSVAVQGLGSVGWGLAERLHAEGATLTVADIRPEVVQRAVDQFGATACAPELIHQAEVDIYSPCAMGGVVTIQTVSQMRARAVAGAANNQLLSREAGEALAARGILFAPDYVINAGGISSGLEEFFRMPGRTATQVPPLAKRLARIRDRLEEIFERSAKERRTPEATAELMARELIGRA